MLLPLVYPPPIVSPSCTPSPPSPLVYPSPSWTSTHVPTPSSTLSPPRVTPPFSFSPRHLPSLRLPPPSRLPPARKQFIPPTLKLAGQWPGYKAARRLPLSLAGAAALIWPGLRRRDAPEPRCQLSPDNHNSNGHCYLIYFKTIKAYT